MLLINTALSLLIDKYIHCSSVPFDRIITHAFCTCHRGSVQARVSGAPDLLVGSRLQVKC
jgi:hypothetical protein